MNPDIIPLRSERSLQAVDPADLVVRRALAQALREIPHDVWGRLEYLQPQIGCFNLCGFCSQSAGSDVWQLTERGLRNFCSALKTVLHNYAHDDGPRIGSGRLEHKPGVIFPYLDNDVFSYPYLDDYIRYLHEDFGAKTRLTSIGYSRHNSKLQAMHVRIAHDLGHAVDGLRLSWTPYAYGWDGGVNRISGISRAEFVADFANMLQTYRPLIDLVGRGKDRACVEVRFPPLTRHGIELVREFDADGHHAVAARPYLLVCRVRGVMPELTHINDLDNRAPIYSAKAVPYTLLVSDRLFEAGADGVTVAARAVAAERPEFCTSGWADAKGNASGFAAMGRCVSLYQFRNDDGPYFAADPFFKDGGLFEAVQFYLPTARRAHGGYLDSSRYFLNRLIRYKNDRGVSHREPFGAALESDADAVIEHLKMEAATSVAVNPEAAEHLTRQVIPLVQAYRQALRDAGYAATNFFDARFTIDTGVIVNQGRAHAYFGNLVSRSDMPITPHEERGYGEVSFNAARGRVYRIAPVPAAPTSQRLTIGVRGRRNDAASSGGVSIVELDGWLRRTSQPEIVVGGVEVERISIAAMREGLMIPGLVAPLKHQEVE